jgi:hypothetical protein
MLHRSTIEPLGAVKVVNRHDLKTYANMEPRPFTTDRHQMLRIAT